MCSRSTASAIGSASRNRSCWTSRRVAQTARESGAPRALVRAGLVPENAIRLPPPSRSTMKAASSGIAELWYRAPWGHH